MDPYKPTGVIPLEQLWFDAPGIHCLRIPQGEQCLSMDVFGPVKAEKPLQAFAFLYGGALIISYSTKTRHDPAALVRLSEEDGQPIVVMTFKYHIGLLGFLTIQALLMRKESYEDFFLTILGCTVSWLYFLNWVQRNVGFFGGDKNNVTVIGNSAGAWTIGFLITIRETERIMLFKNAIFSFSGPKTMSFQPKGSYYLYYHELLRRADASESSPLEERLVEDRFWDFLERPSKIAIQEVLAG
ncbi:Alpha/Beta hydrolase protein [Calycina marina]|uniref:Carboxylic ester hydrolase n=1 Tax=Calycina marina TaxID=1763456 RepID=A0A9P7Z4I5_9HELO|nr:Alpha/Beta hydrolase protein [Calycina marina]